MASASSVEPDIDVPVETTNASDGAAASASENSQTVGRELGTLEYLLWVVDQARSTHFAIAAEIEGRAKAVEWRTAVDRVQKRHPLLSMHVERRLNALPRFVHVEIAPIPLRIVSHTAGHVAWENEIASELANSFDPDKAPLLRAVLLEGEKTTFLILVAHHAIADGLSLAYLVRDTLQTLAGASLQSLPLPLSQDELVAPRALLAASKTYSVPEAPNHSIGPDLTKDLRPDVRSLLLSESLTASLRRRARAEKATVHGALCAACVIAGRDIRPSWAQIPLRIMSPMETRSIFGGADQSCVYVQSTITEVTPAAIQFWDIARIASQSIVDAKAPDVIAASIILRKQIAIPNIDPISATARLRAAFGHEIFLTNIGVVPFGERFGKFKLKALWGPCLMSFIDGVPTIGVSTVGGRIGLLETSGGIERVRLLESLKQVLEGVCK